jgi:hypothetical protein
MKVHNFMKIFSELTFLLTLVIVTIAAPVNGAQPPGTMNYQGYLTDTNDIPLHGSFDLVFRLYDAASGGAQEWGPETHGSVPVTKGIFQVALGTMLTLNPHEFDEALFLEIQVNGETMTPRQPMNAVPYAFGLVPGAEVQGDPVASNYALRVDNTGVATTDRGLYASGEQYGIYAEEVGSESDVGIYSPDFIQAKGYRSNADSYLWVPGTAAVLYPSSGCTLYPQWHGTARLECSTAGNKDINIPITVPGVLYGQNVQIKSLEVYYDLDNADSYINSTYLRKITGAGSYDPVINDTTNRTSTSPTNFSLSPTEVVTLTSSSGALNLNLAIWHDGDLNHDVHVAMIRVRLGHID